METRLMPDKGCSGGLEHRVDQLMGFRAMSKEDFIERHGSGTLRKNSRIGMVNSCQYLHERVMYEYGAGFECQPRSRVTVGEAVTEEDCHPITEAGWYIERYMTRAAFPQDSFSCKYIQVEYKDGTRREGIGIVVEETWAPFLPLGNVVYAIVTPFDPAKKEWQDAINPF